MADPRYVWTEDDKAKLKSMAGKIPAAEIAAALGRTVGATTVEACKLGYSLRTKRAGVSSKVKPGSEILT